MRRPCLPVPHRVYHSGILVCGIYAVPATHRAICFSFLEEARNGELSNPNKKEHRPQP